MKRTTQLALSSAFVLVTTAAQLNAGFELIIQPNAANDTIYFSGTLTLPAGNDDVLDVNAVSDDDGNRLAPASVGLWYKFDNVGNYKTDNNNELFFRDGFAGFQVLSGPTGFDGLYFDDDDPFSDDIAPIFDGPTTPFAAGDFLASIPMHPNGFGHNWNVGTYTNNPNVRIVVTTTPFVEDTAVPEPSSYALLALGGIAIGGWQMRRRKNQSINTEA